MNAIFPLLTIKYKRTFFIVKLVFECYFEITWSQGPLDLGKGGGGTLMLALVLFSVLTFEMDQEDPSLTINY